MVQGPQDRVGHQCRCFEGPEVADAGDDLDPAAREPGRHLLEGRDPERVGLLPADQGHRAGNLCQTLVGTVGQAVGVDLGFVVPTAPEADSLPVPTGVGRHPPST